MKIARQFIAGNNGDLLNLRPVGTFEKNMKFNTITAKYMNNSNNSLVPTGRNE